MKTKDSAKIFYLIVLAQFCGTSVWFAGNSVLPQLQAEVGLPSSSLGFLTSSTQLGFILGTLVFAAAGISDRFSPSNVFFVSSIFASLLNAAMLINTSSFELIVLTRFGVGVSLAGVYPVGMKIAADWNQHGLGHWLGALVGALVLGTAFPYSLKLIPQLPEIENVILAVSAFCVLGGVIVYVFVPDGPFRKASSAFSIFGIVKAFSSKEFRAPALGYFGHMWELYAMWAFIPAVFGYYAEINNAKINLPALAFVTIGVGSLGCYVGGILSIRVGSATLATVALSLSGICCLLSPFIWNLPIVAFLLFMIAWGTTMAADSPQFSTLVAQHAPADVRGSAITMVVCIGFAITIVSIQLLSFLKTIIPFQYLFLVLVPGPALGCLAMRQVFNRQTVIKQNELR
ncbi:MAG TPA: MFS transporter [Chryseosolibacter sp.]